MKKHFYRTAMIAGCSLFFGQEALQAQTNTSLGVQSLQNSKGGDNTALGYRALRRNTTGAANTATGSGALQANTTGMYNTATGVQALQANTTGILNTGIGTLSLQGNTAGFGNTAVGAASLYTNTTGNANVAVGNSALRLNTTGSWNTATGANALASNTTGTENTADGFKALEANTTGTFNTAVGSGALRANTTGYSNTAVGRVALSLNTTGFYNTATGDSSLANNTTGHRNTAYGTFTLAYNTTGFYNTALGFNALGNNTTGTENTSVGFASLVFNSTGSGNTATGRGCLFGNVTGNFNTATGMGAMRLNVEGSENSTHGYFSLLNNSTGSQNTSQGAYALFSNTTGNQNTVSGHNALRQNTTGVGNTAMGAGALLGSTTGSRNAAFGLGAGANFNSNNSTFIGAATDAVAFVTNATAIGYGTVVTGSNQVRIGNNAITSIGGNVNWTALSDGRYKTNIKQNVPGLAFINKLQPVTYNLDMQSLESKLQAKSVQPPSPEEENARAEKATVVYTGFIAQDVEKAAKEVSYAFSGVDAPQEVNGIYGLRYAEFVVPLVKAVQELSAENGELKKQLEEVRKNINDLLKGQKAADREASNTSGAALKQNQPNPFAGSTIIQYSLPPNTASARLVITDVKGRQVKTISLNGSGQGQLTVDASALAAGTYTYGLWVGNSQVDAKRMVIIR